MRRDAVRPGPVGAWLGAPDHRRRLAAEHLDQTEVVVVTTVGDVDPPFVHRRRPDRLVQQPVRSGLVDHAADVPPYLREEPVPVGKRGSARLFQYGFGSQTPRRAFSTASSSRIGLVRSFTRPVSGLNAAPLIAIAAGAPADLLDRGVACGAVRFPTIAL